MAAVSWGQEPALTRRPLVAARKCQDLDLGIDRVGFPHQPRRTEDPFRHQVSNSQHAAATLVNLRSWPACFSRQVAKGPVLELYLAISRVRSPNLRGG